jgi:hypothetical protein
MEVARGVLQHVTVEVGVMRDAIFDDKWPILKFMGLSCALNPAIYRLALVLI